MKDSPGVFGIGALRSVPASSRLDLLGDSTRRWLVEARLVDSVGVVEIDPEVSDTAKTQLAFDLPPSSLVNCVVVAGKREGSERVAACAVLASSRADVNGVVRRALDVRKASFMSSERAVELTGMEYGGITPIGLPPSWPVLVDRRVVGAGVVILGSGVRRSKIVADGSVLLALPNAQMLEGLGR